MPGVRTNKRGIRVLGVAESFRESDAASVLAGVVMRADLVIDGFAFGAATVGGNDATAAIASLYRRLARDDVALVMVSGSIISRYNVVDADRLSQLTGVPVVCLTYKETSGVAEAVRRRFPADAAKLEAYGRLGERRRVPLGPGRAVFVRESGVSAKDADAVVRSFTLQGSVPEPVRVARLLARAASGLRRPSRRGSSNPSGRRGASPRA